MINIAKKSFCCKYQFKVYCKQIVFVIWIGLTFVKKWDK